MPDEHRYVIQRANERGYFPTQAQAKEISRVSAEEYGRRLSGEELTNSVFDDCTDWAVRHVMDGRKLFIFSGTAAEIAGDVADALAARAERQVQVRIEDV